MGVALVTTTNCGHACDRHLTAPIDTVHKLAAATIPIKTLTFIGTAFVMEQSEYGFRLSPGSPTLNDASATVEF